MAGKQSIAAIACAALIACGGDDDPPADPVPDSGPPVMPDTGPADDGRATVVRDSFMVDGFVPPPNPVSGTATPAEFNATRVLRFRSSQQRGEAHAVVVGMPGMWAGATSLEPLARALVQRSIDAQQPIEFWAIDRRANLLEDLSGFEDADADAVAAYYREPSHYRAADTLSFMSEWGLETHIEDVRRVIDRVERSKQRVVLLGHSLGAMFTRSFAGWRFADGTRGSDLVAGLVLVDSAPFYEQIEESIYTGGKNDGFAGLPLPIPGVDAIRAGMVMGNPFGADKMAILQVCAVRAKLAPDAMVMDQTRDTMLSFLLLMSPSRLPRLDNMTAFGLMFDDGSTMITPMAVSIGTFSGPREEFVNAFTGETLHRPSDPMGQYAWIGPDQSDPREATRLDTILDAITSDETNMLEWYFPSRLTLDSIAVARGDVEAGSWADEAGLHVLDGDRVDAPLLAIGTALSTPTIYESAKSLLAPLGEGRPNAGVDRDDERAYRVVYAPELTHFDATVAADGALNPIPEATFEFVMANVSAADR